MQSFNGTVVNRPCQLIDGELFKIKASSPFKRMLIFDQFIQYDMIEVIDKSLFNVCIKRTRPVTLKGVFTKNERGYNLYDEK